MPRYQIHINRATLEDADKVRGMLDVVAKEFGLFDNTADSRVAGTLRSLTEGEYFGFGLGATLAGKQIVIGFNPAKGNEMKLKTIRDCLEKRLLEVFGDRLHVADPDQFIKFENTLPLTREMRQRFAAFMHKKGINLENG